MGGVEFSELFNKQGSWNKRGRTSVQKSFLLKNWCILAASLKCFYKAYTGFTLNLKKHKNTNYILINMHLGVTVW